MPAQNDRGYCTPNNCVVEREQERNRGRERERIDTECDSSETERERERQSEKRYKDPKDRSKKAERANTNRVIAA